MSVAECQEAVDSREFAQWCVFWEQEPYGDLRRQLALLCLVMATGQLKKKGGGSWDMKDFLPAGCADGKREQSQEEINRTLMAFFGIPPEAVGLA